MIVAIVSVVIGLGGFLFGVYQHFATRKIARIAYEISQIADYGVPDSFISDNLVAPVTINIESVGNKSAEHILLRVKTHSQIIGHELHPPDYDLKIHDTDVKLTIPRLNPTQSARLLMQCDGRASSDQIASFELTHSEGEAVDIRSKQFQTVKVDFVLGSFEYDLRTSRLKLTRFGPFRFRDR